jgi:predicted aspartyl protease
MARFISFSIPARGLHCFHPNLSRQLEVKVTGSKEGQSPGGKVSVSLAKVASLAVAEAKLDDVDVGIVDLSHIDKTIGAKIDGDLGYNFLKHFRMELNYRDCMVCFDDPKHVENFGRTAQTEIAMRLANPAKPLVLVDVHANGRGPFQFAIDTGTSTTAIAPKLAKQLGVASSAIGAGTTAGAHVDVSAGIVKSFQVAGAKIDNMTVVVANFLEMLSNAVGPELDGIVGYNFLRSYKVVFDYPNGLLRLFQT